MINLGLNHVSSLDNPAPTAPRSNFENLMELVAFFNNPAAVKQRIGEIFTAASEARDVITSADTVKGEIAQQRLALQDEKTAFEAHMETEKKAFERACKSREHDINIREREIDTLHKAAEDDRNRAAEITADLERRVEALKAAAASSAL